MPKRVGHLCEKMEDMDFIRRTILTAAKGRHQRHDIRPVVNNLDHYVECTYRMIVTDSFKPTTPKEKRIYDPCSQKYRTIKVAPFWPDGVMHWLLVEAMRPVLMRGMCHWSCASVPGRGGQRIRKRIQRIMRRDPKRTKFAAELDVKQYYPSISTKRMMRALERKIKDKRFLRMVKAILDSCNDGLAIGYYICQWLANFYLEPLDNFIMSLPGVCYMVRYMDNITIFGSSKRKLHRARKQIEEFMWDKLGLKMKRNWQIYKTAKRMVSAVGYRYARTHTILRKRNFLRLTRQCRRIEKRLRAGRKITYHQAASLLSRIGQIKHCDSHKIREKYITPIGVKNLKEVVRNENKRRQSAKRSIYAGTGA